MVMMFMFGKKFRRDQARKSEATEWKEVIKTSNLKSTLKTVKAILSWDGIFEELHKIKTPTLVIIGEKDLGIPLSQTKRLVNRIPGAKLVIIPHAGHISSFEEPETVNAAIEEFIDELS